MTDRKMVVKCLECYRMKSPEQRQNCQNTDCPYNNADPHYGNWCCANNLLYDAVTLLEYSFTPEEVCGALVIHGQKDHQFKLGETIKYSPTDVKDILGAETILPCVCGSKKHNVWGNNLWYQVECAQCGRTGQVGSSRLDAIRHWNREMTPHDH